MRNGHLNESLWKLLQVSVGIADANKFHPQLKFSGNELHHMRLSHW